MDPTELSSHFQFGENWQSYAAMVDEQRVAEAVNEHPHPGSGLFGTGCDEYVFRRGAPVPA
ncbi:MAG: hypothetical protein ACM31D_06505 [Bacteroidota bacterium]